MFDYNKIKSAISPLTSRKRPKCEIRVSYGKKNECWGSIIVISFHPTGFPCWHCTYQLGNTNSYTVETCIRVRYALVSLRR